MGKILCHIEIIDGDNRDNPVKITNTTYWMGPNVTVAKGKRSRVRDYGRVWDFDNK